MNKNTMDIKKLPQRKSIRLKNYDYSSTGLYFITICTQDKQNRLGTIKNNGIIINEYGQIAHNEWIELKNRFKNIKLHEFIIMPNHIHGIIEIIVRARARVRATLAVARSIRAGASPAPTDPTNTFNTAELGDIDMRNITLSDIIGTYKSLVTNKCLKIYKSKNEIMGKFWQRNYYEHIIRNEKSYIKISEYIINNPLNWQSND